MMKFAPVFVLLAVGAPFRVFARAKGNARASAPKHETPVNVTSTTRVVLEPRSLS